TASFGGNGTGMTRDSRIAIRRITPQCRLPPQGRTIPNRSPPGGMRQRKRSELPSIQRLTKGADLAHRSFDPTVRDVLLEVLYASVSETLLLPLQDAFGWRDRINEPATVNDRNWTYRLPWPVDRMDEIPEACERKELLRAWSARYGRT